jgi:hypothetical protein
MCDDGGAHLMPKSQASFDIAWILDACGDPRLGSFFRALAQTGSATWKNVGQNISCRGSYGCVFGRIRRA